MQDVGIVGGGAAGLVTALTLLERVPDLDVTVYEKDPEAYTTLCAEGISDKTLELFSAFDTREHCVQTFAGASWWFPGDVDVHVDEPCYTLQRSTWIPAMAQALEARGGTYDTGHKVTVDEVGGLAREHDLLVGADGPGSRVREHIGGQAITRLGVQIRLKAPWDGDRLAFYTHKAFSPEYAWVFPKGEILNVGILGEADGQDWDRIEAFCRWVDEREGTSLANGKTVKREAYPIAFNGTRQAGDNVVLVGDAAGLTNPLTKGGLAAIIHTSQLIADTVEDAVEGRLNGGTGTDVATAVAPRIAEHPVADPVYQEALEIILSWENEDFEKLARAAPSQVTAGGSVLKRAGLLSMGILANLPRTREIWTLYRAMSLSKDYSW